jgi:hypothetical protein
MATVTNIRVAYKRTVQPKDYESATAEIEYSLVIQEDEAESAMETAADMLAETKDQVMKALGIRKAQTS